MDFFPLEFEEERGWDIFYELEWMLSIFWKRMELLSVIDNLFGKFFQFFIGNIFFVWFIVDREQIDSSL